MRQTMQVSMGGAPICTEFKVQHADADSYGVVHFSRYASLIETCFLEYLQERGITIESLRIEGYELRVRELHLKYLAPSRPKDVLLLSCGLAHVGIASLTFNVQMSKPSRDSIDAAHVLVGIVNIALVNSANGSPTPLPRTFVEHLGR